MHFLTLAWIAMGVTQAADTPKPPSAPGWPLPKLIQRATEVALEVKARDQEVLAASYRASQAGKWDNPTLSVGAGPKNSDTVSGSKFELEVHQGIPLFGQKAIDARIGEEERTIAEVDRGNAALALRHEVVRLSYEYAAMTEQAKHISHRREGLNLIARYLGSRPFASPSQAVEKNLILNRVREIESLFLDVSAKKEKAWQALNTLLALDTQISLVIPWYEEAQQLSFVELESAVSKGSPELVRQSQNISLADLTIEQAGKRAYPELALTGAYENEKTDGTEKTYLLGVQLTLPLWSRGTDGKHAAEARKQAETFRYELRKREISARLSQTWAEYTSAQKKLALYPLTLITGLERQFRAAEGGWKKGLVTVSAFLELENQVHEQIVQVFNSQTEFVRSLSEIQLLAGRDFVVTLGPTEVPGHD